MRCPKCDYISFDKEEICGGCKKNISKIAQELSGVVLRGEVPDFLWLQKEEEAEDEPAADEEDGTDEGDAALDMGEHPEPDDNTVEFTAAADEEHIDLAASDDEGAKEIEFDLSADESAESGAEEVKEEIAFDLPDMEEDVPPKPETAPKKNDSGLDLSMEKEEESLSADMSTDGLGDLDFELDDLSGAAQPQKPEQPAPAEKSAKQPKKEKAQAKNASLDLSGIDLSGLMPPSGAENSDGLDGLSLDSDGGKTEKKAGKKSKTKSAADMLPDLSMDALDLNTPSSPSTASAAGKKMRPAAKTGTALDNFDVDLGDLLGGGGKKK
jgi:hypothetical protein